MAQVLIGAQSIPGFNEIVARCRLGHGRSRQGLAASSCSTERWIALQRSLKCSGRFSCLFSDNRKQEQARKALENALGQKKTEYEKWDKEIKRREEAGGGGNSGGGGWFGWRRWYGDGEHFWQEAQQGSLAVLGILVVYLIVAKGDLMLAVIFNPLLFALRGTRNAFSLVTSKIMNRIYPRYGNVNPPRDQSPAPVSVKERVIGKWGSN